MRRRRTRTHRQHAVQQTHALLAPRRQIPRRRNRHAHVLAQLAENVDQRLGERHPRAHRKRQTHRMARCRIRVLPDNQNLHLVERVRKRAQHIRAGRQVAAPLLDLGRQHRAQLVDAPLHRGECPSPTRINQFSQRTGIVFTHSISLMPHKPRHIPRAPLAPHSLLSDSLNA